MTIIQKTLRDYATYSDVRYWRLIDGQYNFRTRQVIFKLAGYSSEEAVEADVPIKVMTLIKDTEKKYMNIPRKKPAEDGSTEINPDTWLVWPKMVETWEYDERWINAGDFVELGDKITELENFLNDYLVGNEPEFIGGKKGEVKNSIFKVLS